MRETPPSSIETVDADIVTGDDGEMDFDCVADMPAILDSTTTAQTTSASSDQSLLAAQMLLQLREGHQVSQVALADVVSGCRMLCTQALSMLMKDVIATLGSSFEAAITHQSGRV